MGAALTIPMKIDVKTLLPMIILLGACALTMCQFPENYGFEMLIDSIPVPELDLENEYEVLEWVGGNIQYKKDEQDEWQSPGRTCMLRTGDCEDFALLAIYLIYRATGKRAVMMYGSGSPDYGNHFWIEINGEWWETIRNWRCEYYEERYPDITDDLNIEAWRFLTLCYRGSM